MTRGKLKIVIIEPSAVVRQGLSVLLQSSGSIEVVKCYDDYQSYLDGATTAGVYDVILINPAIINFHKQFAIRNLFAESSDRYIVAIVYTYVDALTLNGFDGVIDIYDSAEMMTRKLHKICDTTVKNSELNDTVELSDREKEILTALAKGLTNKEIAIKHNISTHTVVSHRKNIVRKTGIKTVSGLTLYCVFNNLIGEDDL